MRRLTPNACCVSSRRPARVFLDFDGPVCQVYPGDLNMRAADQLRARLAAHGVTVPRDVLANEKDPLCHPPPCGPDSQMNAVIQDVERTSPASRFAAVTVPPRRTASATSVEACADADRPVVIVSNNAAEAIGYLDTHGFSQDCCGVVGRAACTPARNEATSSAAQDGPRLLDADPTSAFSSATRQPTSRWRRPGAAKHRLCQGARPLAAPRGRSAQMPLSQT